MKLGLLARADNGGLGAQTWELYKNLNPYKTLVVDISGLNGYRQFYDRYPDAWQISIGFPTNRQIDDFLDGLDAVITVETPYNYYLFERARQLGVKTALQYNYEFLDYLQHPEWAKPDILVAPSPWHANEVAALAKQWGCDWVYLPAPVNRQLFPFKRRKQLKTFLHIAGHKTYEDRNGTEIVYQAIPLVKSDVQFVIRSQDPVRQFDGDYRVKVVNGDQINYWEVQRDEDCLILPRRYGGLSLQLSEALSAGMPAIMTDIEPQNGFLPADWLVPAHYQKQIMTRTGIDIYACNPSDLAAKIDQMAAADEAQVVAWSEFAGGLGASISWERLKPEWEAIWHTATA